MSSDRHRRPSARPVRPSARPTVPSDLSRAVTQPEGKSASSEAKSAAASSAATPEGKGEAKVKAARVSARRSVPPAAPSTPARAAEPEPPSPTPVSKAGAPASEKAAKKSQQQAKGKSKAGALTEPRRTSGKSLPAEPPRGIAVSAPAPERTSMEDGDLYSAREAEPQIPGDLHASPEATGENASQIASRLALGSGADRRAQDAAEKGAQSLLSSDYYLRQYGEHGMRRLTAEVDDYGLDPHVEEQARPWLEALCTRYFRLELEGAQRIPKQGRALLVANRSGAVPWDGLMLRTALRMQRPELQPLRWLSEDSVIHYPFLGTFMNRLGAVRACSENAERMLSEDRLLAVFPEGAQGSSKLFRDRYRLQRFGRGGYVKLALKLGAPILPTAIIGAEETNPLLGKLALFGRTLSPITPTFPWLGPVGLLPAPVKWRVIVGEPVDLSGYGADAADDSLVVHRLNEQIRSILQTLIDQAHASRRSVLFG